VIPERDIWRTAMAMVRRFGGEAMLEAAGCADDSLENGDMAGCETWHRILNAIERLQATAPAVGERIQ
jgi:hypothetical protein